MTTITRSAEEQATRLGVGIDLLYRQCRTGNWPCHKFGRLVRFTDDDEAQILALTARAQAASVGEGLSPRSAARLARAS